jgi:predicted DNA-binding transcriptional regulator YafY
VTSTGDPVQPPPGFDLAEAWEKVVANVDELRSQHHVDAVVDADHLQVLRWMFAKQLTIVPGVDATADGEQGSQVTVRIGGQSVERIAQQLAGLGARVTVLGPDEARACLAQIGRELAATYH